jgi:hypothetical protein
VLIPWEQRKESSGDSGTELPPIVGNQFPVLLVLKNKDEDAKLLKEKG